MKSILPGIRILHRDVSKAEGTIDDFVRCYAKLRERAEKLGQPEIAKSLNDAVNGLRDTIEGSSSARGQLDGIYRVQTAMNRQRRLSRT